MALEWNVWYAPWNGRVCERNVFDHVGVMEDLRKAYRKCKRNGETDEARKVFEDEVRRSLMYHYWAKCEWEVVITHWPQYDTNDPRSNRYSIKVDVWDQVRINWDRFTEYLWSERNALA